MRRPILYMGTGIHSRSWLHIFAFDWVWNPGGRACGLDAIDTVHESREAPTSLFVPFCPGDRLLVQRRRYHQSYRDIVKRTDKQGGAQPRTTGDQFRLGKTRADFRLFLLIIT